MNDRGTSVCQGFGVLAITLPLAIWLALGGLRLLRQPKAIQENSVLANWLRDIAANSSIGHGNVRFWIWMSFLEGLGMAVIALMALAGILYDTFAP